jgi:hypothetical protein
VKKSNIDSETIYPFTSQSITFEKFLQVMTDNPIFPINEIYSEQYFIAGVPDFQFEHEK